MSLLIALISAALAQEPLPPEERAGGGRVHLGGGVSLVPGSGTSLAACLGGAALTRGARLRGALGGELGVGETGAGLPLPVFALDAGLRATPWPTAAARPFLSAGVGVGVIPVQLRPTAHLGLGVELPISARLSLDIELQARHFGALSPELARPTFVTSRVGLGF